MPETTDIDCQKVDPHLTARIVQSYVRHHTVETGQVSDLITSVHRALGQVGQPAQTEEVRTPAVSVRQSVRHDYVVCLDCGYRAKMLRRHISTQHTLSPDEYLKRWGLRSNHPLIAPAYSEQRSTMAKERLNKGLEHGRGVWRFAQRPLYGTIVACRGRIGRPTVYRPGCGHITRLGNAIDGGAR